MALEKKERELLTRPSGCSPTRAATELDMESFKNVGMSFIIREDEEVFYEVVEIGASSTAKWYRVWQFEGCADYIQMDQNDTLEMVKDSVMFTA